MKTVTIDNRTYIINANSVNAGTYTFVIEEGLYDINTIRQLERSGISCHIDKGEGNELVCSSTTPIVEETRIETLEDLAELINESEEWPMDANRAIRDNGWMDDTDTERGVCHTATEKVVIDDDGVAVVVPNEDGIMNQLKQARVSVGMTQKKVAEIMGIEQSSVARLESGAHSPSLDMVERYAEAVGCRLKIEKKEEK